MRPVLMVHGSFARTILTEAEASRLRSQGWLEVDKNRKVSKGASWQRSYRKRQQELGKRELLVWIDDETFEVLRSKQHLGESLAECLERLVKAFDLIE